MLQIHEILDRFELLYPDNQNISDMRRGYIDRDLHSIFRLVQHYNLTNSICVEDIGKLILNDNQFALFRLLQVEILSQLVEGLRKYKDDNSFNADCFSRGQLQSKIWLINELKKHVSECGTIFLCAGWYGILATLLFESGIKIDKIRSFDIDTSCVDIAETFNKPWFTDQWRFKSITQDIMDIDYDEHTWQYWSNVNNRNSKPITDTPDTVINTSCEHITNFAEWYAKIPTGMLLVLQSNNFFEVDEHVNCSETIEDFSKITPMTRTLYQGELVLDHYTRFMKIGIK